MTFKPNYNLVEEFKWRGMFNQDSPGAEDLLNSEMVTGYIGFDPTADSLHIGNLVPIIMLSHLQRSGHKPVVLVGGATGMVGDPSGKKSERKLLDIETIQENIKGQQAQLEKFLNFTEGPNRAIVVNNYDWFKDLGFLSFIREVGKHISVNYMLAKDSVKTRLETGLSFTEFSYQLVQGYDFYYLYKHHGCKLQMGGSDQWGNITTGTELIRRMEGGQAHALTANLITKSDGSKFGKSEGGNVWLDKEKTSPYKFYQFWLNVDDTDAESYIRIFTFLDRDRIEELITQHREAPHTRILQRTLAEEVTRMVHGNDELQNAIDASQIMFGKSTVDALRKLSESDFLSVFEGVDQKVLPENEIIGEGIVDMLVSRSGFLPSNGEARRALKENSVSVNKEKVGEEKIIERNDLINGKYLVLQRGKKNYFLVVRED